MSQITSDRKEWHALPEPLLSRAIRVVVSKEFIEKNFEALQQMFFQAIAVECRYLAYMDAFEYILVAPNFRPLNGDEVETYAAQFHKADDGTVCFIGFEPPKYRAAA